MINNFEDLAKQILIRGLHYKIFYMDAKERDQCVTGWVSYISDNLVGVVGEDNHHYRLKKDSIIEFKYLGKFNLLKGNTKQNLIEIGANKNEISNN